MHLPESPEAFSYDDDGNLTSGGRWAYTWDAENRLLSMQEHSATLPSGWVRRRLEFTYDVGSRRTRKTVKEWDVDHWETAGDRAFVYDGWNLVAELDLLADGDPDLIASYVWGFDLSGTSQGAGGVGGLLWAESQSGETMFVHYAAYDGNGNVIGFVDGGIGASVLKLNMTRLEM